MSDNSAMLSSSHINIEYLNAKRKKNSQTEGCLFLNLCFVGIRFLASHIKYSNTSSPVSCPDGLRRFCLWKCWGTTHYIPRIPSKNSTHPYYYNLTWI